MIVGHQVTGFTVGPSCYGQALYHCPVICIFIRLDSKGELIHSKGHMTYA